MLLTNQKPVENNNSDTDLYKNDADYTFPNMRQSKKPFKLTKYEVKLLQI